jgi:hypothetical protein
VANYDDARALFPWLGEFTAADLAAWLYIDEDMARRFVALASSPLHGGRTRPEPIIEVVGAGENGDGPLYRYRPLPPAPTDHPHMTPPELWASTGAYSEAPVRGYPIAGSGQSEREMRIYRSITGNKKARKQRRRMRVSQ